MKIVVLSILISLVSSFSAQVTVFNDDFSTGISASWTLLKVDANTCVPSATAYNTGWISVGDSMIGSCSNFSPAGTADRWIISPVLALGAYGNLISWRAMSFDPSFPDAYEVLISTTGTNTADFTENIYSQTAETPEWDSTEINLSLLGHNAQNIYVAFRHKSVDKNILFVDNVKIVKESSVGLTQNTVAQFKVYPNPAQDVITIQAKNTPTCIELFTTNGVKVAIVAQQNTLDISQLQAGVYFLTVVIDGQTSTQKISKI